jgi:Saxitoxin biosynthesis operon protein SxtJ
MSETVQRRERSFGLSIGSVLLTIAAVSAFRGHVLRAETVAGVGAVLIVLAALKPALLKRPNDLWWRLARVLAYVNARVLLTLLFFAVLVPVGMVRRLAGWDPLGRRREKWAGWSPHPPRYADPKHYSRMF